MTNQENELKKEYGLICVFTVVVYLCLMWAFTGNGPYTHNTYNNYALQADAWRHGRLDLGQDYGHLEIAEYNGKYYSSFPPFPSYILFPLAFLFGSNTPDALIMWIADVLIAVYLYKLALHFGLKPPQAALSALFVSIGTNVTFNMLNPWVWFWAQTLCFLLAILAIYYAFKGKGALALAFWACSVGCRPMQAVFFPVLIAILYKVEKDKDPEISLLMLIRRRILWIVPMCIIAFSYMLLNYLRFGNPLEFGHNYLPEFVEAEYGQFDPHYFSNCLHLLFNFPEFRDGRMVVDHFGNLNMFIASPFFAFAVIVLVIVLCCKEYKLAAANVAVMLFCSLYMIITMMHRTMGGWHFGNRYSNDILPWIYMATMMCLTRHPRVVKYQIPFFAFGICLNAVGLVIVYNGL